MLYCLTFAKVVLLWLSFELGHKSRSWGLGIRQVTRTEAIDEIESGKQ